MNKCCLSYACRELDWELQNVFSHHPNCEHFPLKFESWEQKARFTKFIQENKEFAQILANFFRQED